MQIPETRPNVGDKVLYRIGELKAGQITQAITGESVRVPYGIVAHGQSRITRVVGFNPAYRAWVVRAESVFRGGGKPSEKDCQVLVCPAPDSDGDWREARQG